MPEDDLANSWRAPYRRAQERFRPDELIGLPEAEARARVEGSGGEFEAHPPDAILTMDLRTNRIRAEIVDGKVVSASIG